MHTPPNGFEANDELCAPNAHVPNKDGYLVMPKWVQYLEDGCIATYTIGAPIDFFPYITEIYAEPSINDNDELFEPMPHWFRAAMHANKSHWQVLCKKAFKLAYWGIAANLKWHWDLTKTAEELLSRIEFMQRDLKGAMQAVDLCGYRLQVTYTHKYIDHA